MLKRVLLATDGSPGSLAAAHWIAAAARSSPGLAVRVLHVHPTVDPALETVPGAHGVLPEAVDPAELARLGEPALAAAQQVLAGAPVTVRTETRAGVVAEEILRAAAHDDLDAVVLGRRGRNPLGRLLLGSVCERVVHLSSLPVLVVPEAARGDAPLRRILLATDGSRAALAAARWAGRIADGLPDARVTALHVFRSVSDYTEVGPDGMPVMPAVPLDVAMANTARPVFDATLDALGAAGRNAETRMAIGDPAAEVVAAVRDGGHDLIVVGHRGLNPLAELLLGSVSDRVMRLAPCPVAVVHG